MTEWWANRHVGALLLVVVGGPMGVLTAASEGVQLFARIDGTARRARGAATSSAAPASVRGRPQGGGTEAAERRGASLPRLVPQVRVNERVDGLAVSRDGRIVATAGRNGVSMWSTASGKMFRRLAHSRTIAVALTADGGEVLTVGLGDGAVWDVTSGEVNSRFGGAGEIGLSDAVFPMSVAALLGDRHILLCGGLSPSSYRGLGCNVAGLWPEKGALVESRGELGNHFDFDATGGGDGVIEYIEYSELSVAHDESELVLRRSDGSAEWIDLRWDGGRLEIPVDDALITAVEALGGARVLVGLSNGEVRLVDMERGELDLALETGRPRVTAVARLDDERVAVAVFGLREREEPQFVQELGMPAAYVVGWTEILIVSQADMSVLQRLYPETGVVRTLAAGGDGRWLVSSVRRTGNMPWFGEDVEALENGEDLGFMEEFGIGRDAIQLWNTVTWQVPRSLSSPAVVSTAVEFGMEDEDLLVSNEDGSTLWSLDSGGVVQRFGGGAMFTEEGVVYYSAEEGLVEWSPGSGHRERLRLVEDAVVLGDEEPVLSVMDRVNFGLLYDDAKLLRLFAVTGEEAVGRPKDVRLEVELELERSDGKLYSTADRLLLYGTFGEDGVELVRASTGESLWVRDHLLPDGGVVGIDEAWLAADLESVVVGIATGGQSTFLVLDADDGDVRLAVTPNSGTFGPGYYEVEAAAEIAYDPAREHASLVFGDGVVDGILVSRDDGRVERVSLSDGLVGGSARLGMDAGGFSVSAGNIGLLYDDDAELPRLFAVTGEEAVGRPEDVRLEVELELERRDGKLYSTADRLLLYGTLGDDGVELVRASTGESLWVRDHLLPDGGWLMSIDEAWLAADLESVVVGIATEGLWSTFVVLDTDDGDVRLAVTPNSGTFGHPGYYEVEAAAEIAYDPEWEHASLVGDGVVDGILVSRDDGRVERVSLSDGLVEGSARLGMDAGGFSVAAGKGTYVFVEHVGEAVVWDVVSGEVSATIEVGASGPEDVAFSGSGEMLAVVERDGVVGLWDLSDGPARLRRLARLMVFEDGGWGVVGEDGRYDGSDPADLQGLGWVVPEAPTQVVPLAAFFAEYYEPGLLTRLLAGEVFPALVSIGDVDLGRPEVEIVSVEAGERGRVNVTVEVRRAAASDVGEMKLFRDGRLVAVDGAWQVGGGSGSGDVWRVEFGEIALPRRGLVMCGGLAESIGSPKRPSIRGTRRWSSRLMRLTETG